MAKVTIEVEEGALEAVDALCHRWYSIRCTMRNWGGYEYWDDSGKEYGDVCRDVEYYIKPLAKKFGLYPYNQETVKYP